MRPVPIKVRKEWERELLDETFAFVKKVSPALDAETRVKVVTRIYYDMHKTLELFHREDEDEIERQPD